MKLTINVVVAHAGDYRYVLAKGIGHLPHDPSIEVENLVLRSRDV